MSPGRWLKSYLSPAALSLITSLSDNSKFRIQLTVKISCINEIATLLYNVFPTINGFFLKTECFVKVAMSLRALKCCQKLFPDIQNCRIY